MARIPEQGGATLASRVTNVDARASSLETHAEGWVNVKSYGARGDGATDDTAAIQAAASAASGKELVFPPGTYRTSSSAVILDGTSVRFLGKNAKVDYRGTGAAFEIQNSKNIAIHDLHVDMTNAGSNAIGLWVRGCWFLQVYKPRVQGGHSSHTGILIETSRNGGDVWGSYLVEIYNPDLRGPGAYGIRTLQTSGDTGYEVTHLNVYAGWSKEFSYGLHYRNTGSFQVRGFVADNGIDGINIATSYDGVVEPGELGPNSGYGINWGTGCAAMTLVAPSGAGVGGTLGYQNNTNYTPQAFSQGALRVYGSRTDQSYFAEFHSAYLYAESFYLLCRGDGDDTKIMKWGNASGLELDPGILGPIKLARVPEYADNAAAVAAGKPVNSIYRTGDLLKIVHS